MFSNYTSEELIEALLKSEDLITELQMKYKRMKALHAEYQKRNESMEQKSKELRCTKKETEEKNSIFI